MAKIPAPMIAAMPSIVRSKVPRLRLSPVPAASASAKPWAASDCICAIDFLRNRELAIFFVPNSVRFPSRFCSESRGMPGHIQVLANFEAKPPQMQDLYVQVVQMVERSFEHEHNVASDT